MKYTKNLKGSIAHLNQDLNSYAIKPDLKYLLSVLNVRRHSRGEVQNQFVDDLEVFYDMQGATVERDDYGNLYVTKGKANQYPCVIAHTDINQEKRSNVSVLINGDFIFGFDNDEAVQAGIGADDGCGIAIAYEMFNRFETIKLFFPKDEEVGLIGTGVCDISFFTDCTLLIQPDRRSYSTDLITYTNGIKTCSKEFVEAASDIMTKYGYSENRGVCTDVGSIKKSTKVTCVGMNISCGYYNEHSDEEVISIIAYTNAVNFIYDLINELGHTKWYHVHEPEQMTFIYPSKSHHYDDDYYSQDFPKDTVKDKPFYDEAYNDYVLEVYSHYKDKNNRDNLISFTEDLEELDSFLFPQEDIDKELFDGTCPVCYDKIELNNELALNICCPSCHCMFNCTELLDEDVDDSLFPNKDNSQLDLFE